MDRFYAFPGQAAAPVSGSYSAPTSAPVAAAASNATNDNSVDDVYGMESSAAANQRD